MKCQFLFSRKKIRKETKLIILSSAEFAHSMVSVDSVDSTII